MKRFFSVLSLAVLCGALCAGPASAAVKDFPWCTVEYPETVESAKITRIIVTPKDNVPAGMKVGCHMYYFKENMIWGGFLAYGAPQDAVPGKANSFFMNVKAKPGMETISAVPYLSPDGDIKKKTQEAKVMIRYGSAAPASVNTPAAATAGMETKELSWCTVQYPAAVNGPKKIKVIITPKGDLPAGMQAGCHLHYFKGNAWGGFLAYSNAKPARDGEALTFILNVQDKPEMTKININVFLSPDGKFETKTKGDVIPIPYSAAPSVSSTSAAPATGAASVSGGMQTKEFPWCTVQYPATLEKAKITKIIVTPKTGIPAGMKIGCHMYWFKENNVWGGFLAYGAPQNAVAGKANTFFMNVKEKDGMMAVSAVPYLSPDGDIKAKTQEATVRMEYTAGTAKAAAEKAALAAYPARPESITFKKSSAWIEKPCKPVTTGDTMTLEVEYYLDPSETWGDRPTKLYVQPLGPWIDNPDGVVNKRRTHIYYASINTQTKEVAPGRGKVIFSWKVGHVHRYNEMFFLLKFIAPNGEAWPWDWRGGSATINRNFSDGFMLTSRAVGGLFFDNETPVIDLSWGKNIAAGEETSAIMTVTDIDGAQLLQKTVSVTPGTPAEIPLSGISKRGVFLLKLDVPGIGSDYTYFGKVPSVPRTAGKETPFSATYVGSESLSRLAYRLGFSYVRHFTGWRGLQPMKDVWNLSGMDRTIEANTNAGLKPWISLQGAPVWALPEGMYNFGFEPAPFDLKAWDSAVTTLAKRYRGKLFGFEWLNEIVPGGKTPTPVQCYYDICRVGTTAAKKVDPDLYIQLAGGLWPHTFRIDLLNKGIAEYIDALPVHYSTYSALSEAIRDLKVRGIQNVDVIDNESASGFSTWNMDPQEALTRSRGQCFHVMTRWPDVLTAGAKMVCYFGGPSNSAGNWTYLLDENTPRPVAATLAVVQGKLANAKPVAKFYCQGAAVHYFEKADGKALIFLSDLGATKESMRSSAEREQALQVSLPAEKGAAFLSITDYQGNVVRHPAGTPITASSMPVIIEGVDADYLRLLSSTQIGASTLPVPVPSHVDEPNPELRVTVRVKNTYHVPKTFTLIPGQPSWGTAEKIVLKDLKPGEEAAADLVYTPGEGAKPAPATELTLTVSVPGQNPAEKPFLLYAVDSASAGNLIQNADFNKDVPGEKIAGWIGEGSAAAAPLPGEPGNQALKLEGLGRYTQLFQDVKVPVPGQRYLYTAWVWSKKMNSGSNMEHIHTDGSTSRFYMPHIFSTGAHGTGYWRFLAKTTTTAGNIETIRVQPVGTGNKSDEVYTLYDNISLSIDKGTSFVGFAPRVGSELPSGNAGKLLPLLCDNQITATGAYKWTPESLAGVAQFSWDDAGLVFHVDVADDQMTVFPVTEAQGPNAPNAGMDTLKGDSIALCIYPKMGVEGPADDQLRWYISKASPGGGSGACTVYRPAAYALGAKSGQLVKDSSVYACAIERTNGLTTYELRIPWAEIPGFTPAKGASFGCNIELHDSDGSAADTGIMTWGTSLRETASDCGLITLMP